jgi:hypothetical protein
MVTYSPSEVAERLGVSTKWLGNLAAKRQIPHLLIARKLRFTEAHVSAIIAAYEVPLAEPMPSDEDGPPPRTERPHSPNPKFPGVGDAIQ